LLALKMCWKPPPRQAPGRYANMADKAQRKTLNMENY
jgi:hypothetical protein